MWRLSEHPGRGARQRVPVTPTYTSSSRCTVASGRWYSYHDGLTWTNASDVDIDDVVAPKEAWESGAHSWSSTNRTTFANDLSYGPSLVAVTDNVNASKGAHGGRRRVRAPLGSAQVWRALAALRTKWQQAPSGWTGPAAAGGTGYRPATVLL